MSCHYLNEGIWDFYEFLSRSLKLTTAFIDQGHWGGRLGVRGFSLTSSGQDHYSRDSIYLFIWLYMSIVNKYIVYPQVQYQGCSSPGDETLADMNPKTQRHTDDGRRKTSPDGCSVWRRRWLGAQWGGERGNEWTWPQYPENQASLRWGELMQVMCLLYKCGVIYYIYKYSMIYSTRGSVLFHKWKWPKPPE